MADLQAKAILSAEDRASAVLAMVARNFDRLNRAADTIGKRDAAVGRINAYNNAMANRAAIVERLGAGYRLMDRGVGMIPGMYASGGLALAPLAAAAAALKAKKAFAEQERAMTRIAITGDATRAQQDQAALDIERLAARTSLAMKDVREGADTLVAAGRSLPEAMKFLPAVANTAQATGAAVVDIAKSADALEQSLKIGSGQMQAAFDIMAAGGKAGKFELKDMARYFAELAPMAKTAGISGTAGLTSLVAALQMVRKESGTSEEAATNLKNVFSKMYSEETGKKFQKQAGIDLRKRLDEAEKAGKNLLEVFTEITAEATKSGKVKLPQLFEDMQAQAGMRALINNLDEWRRLQGEITRTAPGSVGKDLSRVLADGQTSFDRLSAAAGRAWRNIGQSAPVIGGVDAVTRAVDKLNDALEKADETKRKLDEAGVKPIEKTKTRTQADAEKALEDAGKAATASPSRKDVYGEDWIKRSPAEIAERAFAERRRHVAALEAEAESRRGRNVSDRAREADDIATGGGRFGEAMRDARASVAAQRAAGDTLATLDAAASPMAARLSEILNAIAYSAAREKDGKTGLTEAEKTSRKEEARALVGEILDIQRQKSGGLAPTDGEVSTALLSLIEAARKIGSDGGLGQPKGAIEPGKIADILNGNIKAKVEPDQITAKVEGKVETVTTIRVEPSPNFIATVTSQVKSQIGPVFGSTGSSDGVSTP